MKTMIVAGHLICCANIIYAAKYTPTYVPEDKTKKVTKLKKEQVVVVLDNDKELVLDCTFEEFCAAFPKEEIDIEVDLDDEPVEVSNENVQRNDV